MHYENFYYFCSVAFVGKKYGVASLGSEVVVIHSVLLVGVVI